MGAGRGHLLPREGGGGKGVNHLPKKTLYETVEEEQGSYDKLT